MMLFPCISYQKIEKDIIFTDLLKFVSISIQANEKQKIETPLRSLIISDHPYSCFGTMPAFHNIKRLYMVKIATFIDHTNSHCFERSVHSLVLVFCGFTGKVVAILDGEAVTNLKCAVLAAYVTNICSVSVIDTMCIIGAGTMARNLVKGITEVRKNIKQIKVYSRTLKNVEKFINEISAWTSCQGITFTICSDIKEAIANSDIICTATTTPTELIESFGSSTQQLHINCMGAHKGESREISSQILKDSFLIVEDLETAVSELGVSHKNAVEICQLHKLNQQTLQTQITIFSSTGHAAFDYLVSEFIIKSLKKGNNIV